MTRRFALTPGARRRAERQGVRWSRRAALGRLAAVGAGLALLPALGAQPASAQPGRCANDSGAMQRRPVAPVMLAADLPDPFTYRPDGTDQAALRREVGGVVRAQAAEVGVEACYLEKVAP